MALTILYLKTIQPNLINKKTTNHIKIITLHLYCRVIFFYYCFTFNLKFIVIHCFVTFIFIH